LQSQMYIQRDVATVTRGTLLPLLLKVLHLIRWYGFHAECEKEDKFACSLDVPAPWAYNTSVQHCLPAAFMFSSQRCFDLIRCTSSRHGSDDCSTLLE
jgi:hypothetical protein